MVLSPAAPRGVGSEIRVAIRAVVCTTMISIQWPPSGPLNPNPARETTHRIHAMVPKDNEFTRKDERSAGVYCVYTHALEYVF